DRLVARGLTCLHVLDLSSSALARARERLGPMAAKVNWIEGDVTGPWPAPSVDIWHDRAVVHFLTTPDQRARYVARVPETVGPGGAVVIATFALDGPERCSGLPVVHYSAESLSAELGPAFLPRETAQERHRTPAGATQQFLYTRFVRR